MDKDYLGSATAPPRTAQNFPHSTGPRCSYHSLSVCQPLIWFGMNVSLLGDRPAEGKPGPLRGVVGRLRRLSGFGGGKMPELWRNFHPLPAHSCQPLPQIASTGATFRRAITCSVPVHQHQYVSILDLTNRARSQQEIDP